MMLAYYRNNLSHIFIFEAFISVSILTLPQDQSTIDKVWERVLFLKDLLNEEFIARD